MEIASWLQAKLELFKEIPSSDLNQLIGLSKVTNYLQNEFLIEQGEPVNYIGILLEGQAEICLYLEDGTKHTLELLNPSAIFGEPDLISGKACFYNLVAKTDLKALLIPDSALSLVIQKHPKALKLLTGLIQEREASFEKMLLNERLNLKPFSSLNLVLKDPSLNIVIISFYAQNDELSWSVYETQTGKKVVEGKFSQLGSDKAFLVFLTAITEKRIPIHSSDYETLFKILKENIFTAENKLSYLLAEEKLILVAFKLQCAQEDFHQALIIDDENLAKFEKLNSYQQKLNQTGINLIYAARNIFQRAIHFAVFDSAFHQTLPVFCRIYPLPFELIQRYNLYALGWQGLAHQYAALKAAELLNLPYNSLEIIVVYLTEEETSVCAIDHGRSVYVSSGFSSTEGLPTFSCSGSLDPKLIFELAEKKEFSIQELSDLLTRKSGLKGLAGIQGNFYDLEHSVELGHQRSLYAYRLFVQKLRHEIGGAATSLGGIDALVFTGELGYNCPGLRSLVCKGLDFFGIKLDEQRNFSTLLNRDGTLLSNTDSQVKIITLLEDQNFMLAFKALQTWRLNNNLKLFKNKYNCPVPIEVSAHHLHLTEKDFKQLFGPEAELEVDKELSQPGQYAAKQTVTLHGPKGRIERVRILGPFRAKTQVEIAMTGQFKLGLVAPIRESGDLAGSPGLVLEGPAGLITIEEGVICALRHIHMAPEDALNFGLKDKDIVKVKVNGDRELVFGDVLVRVSPHFRLAMHIDTDEANASHVKTGDIGFIVEIQSRSFS